VFFRGGRYVESAALSANKGIKNLYDTVRKEFLRAYHKELDDSSIRTLLSEGRLVILGDEYSLDLDPIIKGYAESIESILNDFLDGLPSIDAGIVAGGGAIVLKGKLKINKKLIIMPEPEYANAKGYWYYGVKSRN
jgi:hypothetical protein